MRKLIIVLLAVPLLVSAQVISFGVKAGVPATNPVPDIFGTFGLADTGRWTVGPTMEVHLFRGLSAEVDALYRGYRVSANTAAFAIIPSGPSGSTGGTGVAIASAFRQETKTWDFPVLLKYRFGNGAWRPFVDGGYIRSHQSSDITSRLQCLASQDTCNAAFPGFPFNAQDQRGGFSSDTNAGSAGVGVEYRYRKIKIGPEVRYSRSNRDARNQVAVIVGFTF